MIDSRQFGLGNGGWLAARAKVRGYISHFYYAATLEINDFYQSLIPNWVCEEFSVSFESAISIIQSEYQYTSTGALCSSNYSESPNGIFDHVKQGLPSGLMSSSIIAEVVFGKILSQIPDCRTRIINYASSFLLMAPSQADIGAKLRSLKDIIDKAPSGNFATSEKHFVLPDNSIDFINCKFIRSVDGVYTIHKRLKRPDACPTS